MSTSYNYSKITDLNNNLNARQLHNVIAASGIASATFQHIETIDDVVKIWFNGALSAGDQTTLSNLITQHSTAAIIPAVKTSIVLTGVVLYKKTDNTTYTVMGAKYYLGSAGIGPIKKIFITAKSSQPYSLKVMDITNAKTIVEKTNIINDDYQIVNLGVLSNISVGPASIEIYAKSDDSDGVRVRIRDITFTI